MTRQDAAATNAALYAIVSQQHDPSLLQYADWESLAFDLSLPPGGSKEMSLEYEEVLAPSGGLYRYRYVLSTERYSSLPLDEVSVTVDLSTSSGLASLYSPSHAVHTEHLGAGRARADLGGAVHQPQPRLRALLCPDRGGLWRRAADRQPGRRPGRAQRSFPLSLFARDRDPPDRHPAQGHRLCHRPFGQHGGRKDRAGPGCPGLYPGPARRGGPLFHRHLRRPHLGPGVRTCSPSTGAALDAARRYVDQLSADGSTDLESALQTGLEILERSENRGVPRMVVFLTDGLPTAGITDEARIAQLVTKTNSAAGNPPARLWRGL